MPHPRQEGTDPGKGGNVASGNDAPPGDSGSLPQRSAAVLLSGPKAMAQALVHL